MASSTLQRNALFRLIASCLMQVSEARAPLDVVAALAGLFQGLPATWFAIDAFGSGGIGRRAASHNCPRGFAAFLTRLGFLGRQDGTYQGTFADSTLLLIKVGALASSDHGLVSAAGFPKFSPLNDGAVMACISALIHSALGRALSLEADHRRRAMLEASITTQDEWLALFDANGVLVERYPAGGDPPVLPPETAPLTHGSRRRVASQTVTTPGGRSFNLRTHWIGSERPFEQTYRAVRARGAQTQPLVTDRLHRYGLSKREFQIAELVFTGTTNRRIAETLFISHDTVKTHCKHIFRKLGISRRAEFLRVVGESSLPARPL
ncbi:MAG: helix-turn-helix transcriptional regulator [Vicinamibacterales bacterium]